MNKFNIPARTGFIVTKILDKYSSFKAGFDYVGNITLTRKLKPFTTVITLTEVNEETNIKVEIKRKENTVNEYNFSIKTVMDIPEKFYDFLLKGIK